jgi:hypothetical protein
MDPDQNTTALGRETQPRSLLDGEISVSKVLIFLVCKAIAMIAYKKQPLMFNAPQLEVSGCISSILRDRDDDGGKLRLLREQERSGAKKGSKVEDECPPYPDSRPT